jgi:hypothetical protein
MRPCAKYSACALVMAFMVARGALAQTAAPKNTQTLITNFPIPVHEKGDGVGFPYWEDGKLKMRFNVDVMERTDLEHVEMTNAKIITYDDDQNTDLILLLPVSVLDLTTRILTSDKPFVLKKTDFEMMGDSLQLDTFTRQAKILGKVKMVIYNFDVSTGKDPVHE